MRLTREEEALQVFRALRLLLEANPNVESVFEQQRQELAAVDPEEYSLRIYDHLAKVLVVVKQPEVSESNVAASPGLLALFGEHVGWGNYNRAVREVVLQDPRVVRELAKAYGVWVWPYLGSAIHFGGDMSKLESLLVHIVCHPTVAQEVCRTMTHGYEELQRAKARQEELQRELDQSRWQIEVARDVLFGSTLDQLVARMVKEVKQNKASGQIDLDAWGAVSIKAIWLSSPVKRSLVAAGVETVAGVLRLGTKVLGQLKGMGPAGVEEVQRALQREYGLTLK